MSKTKKGKTCFADRDDLIPGVDYSWRGLYGSVGVDNNPEGWKRHCEEDPDRNPILQKARSARVKRIRHLLWEAVRREDGYKIYLKLIGGWSDSSLEDLFRIWCPEEWERLRGLKAEEVAREQQEGEIADLLERLRGEDGPEVLHKVLVQVHHNRFEDALDAGKEAET